jgi:hypothetical protein
MNKSANAVFGIAGASVVGESHLKQGKTCEDYHAFLLDSHWAIAVVSDGAGSAPRGLEGATCVATAVLSSLSTVLSSVAKTEIFSAQASLEAAVIDGIEEARQRCTAELRGDEQLNVFNATIVGAILLEQGGLLFHIGDGGISVHKRVSDELHTIAFSSPENGEYKEQTFFFAGRQWREHLRFTPFADEVDSVWVMSDGAYECIVPCNAARVRAVTEREISQLVFTRMPEKWNDAVSRILSSEQARAKSDDDKTLVILSRRSSR